MVDACIRESQRLYPVAPFVVRHLTSDLHLKDGEQKHRSPIFLQFLRSRSLPDLSPGIFQRIFFRTEISPGVFQRFFFCTEISPGNFSTYVTNISFSIVGNSYSTAFEYFFPNEAYPSRS